MAGEYRGGEAFTPSVIEGKKSLVRRSKETRNGAKKRGVGRVFIGKNLGADSGANT